MTFFDAFASENRSGSEAGPLSPLTRRTSLRSPLSPVKIGERVGAGVTIVVVPQCGTHCHRSLTYRTLKKKSPPSSGEWRAPGHSAAGGCASAQCAPGPVYPSHGLTCRATALGSPPAIVAGTTQCGPLPPTRKPFIPSPLGRPCILYSRGSYDFGSTPRSSVRARWRSLLCAHEQSEWSSRIASLLPSGFRTK